jgi:hypothetical protein
MPVIGVAAVLRMTVRGQTLSKRALHLSARVEARAAVDRYSLTITLSVLARFFFALIRLYS